MAVLNYFRETALYWVPSLPLRILVIASKKVTLTPGLLQSNLFFHYIYLKKFFLTTKFDYTTLVSEVIHCLQTKIKVL
jgi:hypothetical protein